MVSAFSAISLGIPVLTPAPQTSRKPHVPPGTHPTAHFRKRLFEVDLPTRIFIRRQQSRTDHNVMPTRAPVLAIPFLWQIAHSIRVSSSRYVSGALQKRHSSFIVFLRGL